MPVGLTRKSNDIWVNVPLGDYIVLRKPNPWQNRIQFFENWITSKLIRGNAYILKQRNRSDNVVGMYVLSPDLVQVLVSEDGAVFYKLQKDNLTGVEDITVPASEIIHDRFNCLYHPLVGISPLYACSLAASQGFHIQKNSDKFFKHMSRPSGILSAPGAISNETAQELKDSWMANYSGENYGRVAVLGDDLKYVPLSMTAEEAQLVEQLKMTAETVCSAFHVPPYKVVGNAPSYNNIEALEQQYYSQCLQILIESIELCLDEGLGVPDDYGVEFDLDVLLRMDKSTQVKTLSEGVKGGLHTPNEARKKLNSKPIEGGDTVYLQQQYYSLEALSKRDASDPFAKEPMPSFELEERDYSSLADRVIKGLEAHYNA